MYFLGFLVLHRAQAVHQQALEQANRTETLSVDLTDVFEKLQDLMNNSRHSMDNTQSSNGFVFRSRELLNEIKVWKPVNVCILNLDQFGLYDVSL